MQIAWRNNNWKKIEEEEEGGGEEEEEEELEEEEEEEQGGVRDIAIPIRMVLFRKLSIGPLDFLVRCRLLDTKRPIVVFRHSDHSLNFLFCILIIKLVSQLVKYSQTFFDDSFVLFTLRIFLKQVSFQKPWYTDN